MSVSKYQVCNVKRDLQIATTLLLIANKITKVHFIANNLQHLINTPTNAYI